MTRKICTKCKCEKDIKEFNFFHPAKRDGKYRPDCKECVRNRNRKVYDHDPLAFKDKMKIIHEKAVGAAKEYVNEYLATHPCVDCGESDLEVLDFDHVRGVKLRDVSRMVSVGYRLWRIKEEIEKCEVRCANDHRRATARRRKEMRA